MECYLDNSATTRCLDSAAALMAGILCTDYGNPIISVRALSAQHIDHAVFFIRHPGIIIGRDDISNRNGGLFGI